MRPKNAVPTYLRHKKSGTARVRISGREFSLGRYNSPESLQKYRELIANPDAVPARKEVNPEPSGFTLAECMLRYLQHATTWPASENGCNTEYQHFRALFRLIEASNAELPVDEFRGPLVKELQTAMVAKGWSRKYANAQLGRLRRFADWCLSEDLCGSEVVAKIKAVQVLKIGRTDAPETEPVLPVDEATYLATLPHLPEVVADLCKFIAMTGARPSEVRRLRIGEIDRSGDVWEAKLRRHKNAHRGKRRVLFFGPAAQQVLSKYLNRDANDFVFSPRESERLRLARLRENRKTKIQPSQICRVRKNRILKLKPFYSRDALCRALSRACEIGFGMPENLRRVSRELPVEDRAALREQAAQWRKEHCWTPYQLRHSAAQKIREQFDLEFARATLGHSTDLQTLGYAREDAKRARQVAVEIG